MEQPFISICIPTYRRPQLLKKLLDSILAQTFTDYEVLINDNSPDDTVRDLVETYEGKLAIDYEKNEPGLSATQNCNRVMKRARANWVKVMHDDDWFEGNDALQQFADAASNAGKDFIFCASNQVYLETGKKELEELSGERKQMLEDSFFSLFYLNVIGHPSVVMHKKDLSLEYDPAFNWVLDVDYYVRYLDAHNGFHYINKPLINIGKSSAQESYRYYKNRSVEIPEYFKMLTRYDNDLDLKNIYVFHLVWNMMVRYKIKRVEDIRALGYDAAMPARIEEVIKCVRKYPGIILKQPKWSKKIMESCFRKLKEKAVKRH